MVIPRTTASAAPVWAEARFLSVWGTWEQLCTNDLTKKKHFQGLLFNISHALQAVELAFHHLFSCVSIKTSRLDRHISWQVRYIQVVCLCINMFGHLLPRKSSFVALVPKSKKMTFLPSGFRPCRPRFLDFSRKQSGCVNKGGTKPWKCQIHSWIMRFSKDRKKDKGDKTSLNQDLSLLF